MAAEKSGWLPPPVDLPDDWHKKDALEIMRDLSYSPLHEAINILRHAPADALDADKRLAAHLKLSDKGWANKSQSKVDMSVAGQLDLFSDDELDERIAIAAAQAGVALATGGKASQDRDP